MTRNFLETLRVSCRQSVSHGAVIDRTADVAPGPGLDALAARDGTRAGELWITDLRYGARLISDALMTLPELSQVNLGRLAPLSKGP